MDEPGPIRYRSPDEDSSRWAGFGFRDGDIVISTRSKHGTTWMQAICALLVHGPELPAPLHELSPWLDWLGEPADDVLGRLDRQSHRRIIKTHTPLDGVPLDPRAAFVVVARHPLDAAISLYHQGDNIDRARVAELTGVPAPRDTPRPELDGWLSAWIDAGADPRDDLDSLPGVMHHFTDAWGRRTEPNVVMVHFDELSADLDGEVCRLAASLGIEVSATRRAAVVRAASFESMRATSTDFAPDRAGILRDPGRFFRQGASGERLRVLSDVARARYEANAARLAPADLLAWLHR